MVIKDRTWKSSVVRGEIKFWEGRGTLLYRFNSPSTASLTPGGRWGSHQSHLPLCISNIWSDAVSWNISDICREKCNVAHPRLFPWCCVTGGGWWVAEERRHSWQFDLRLSKEVIHETTVCKQWHVRTEKRAKEKKAMWELSGARHS